MDRSDFCFKQVVTQAEMDQAFDDVERMEQDRTVDDDIWGVWNGLLVQPAGPPDLTVDITAGIAHDELGRRIENPSAHNEDLSTYVPTTAGWQRKVHVYVEDNDSESDPRIDGAGSPLNYRKAESYDVHIEAGTASAPPAASPSIVANKVLLAEVTLDQGMTQITTSEISGDPKTAYITGHRQQGGIAWVRGRACDEHLIFAVSGVDRVISGPSSISLKAGGTPGTDTGLGAGDRDIEDVGELRMTDLATGGLGIDMIDRPVNNCLRFNCLAGGTPGTDVGADLQDRDAINVGRLVMTTSGSSGLGIVMGGTNVTMGGGDITGLDALSFGSSATGIGGSTDPLPVLVGLIMSGVLDMNGQDIDMGFASLSDIDALDFGASATGVGGSTDPLPVNVDLSLETNRIRRARGVAAELPDVALNKGFYYIVSGTDTLATDTRWITYDATAMFPGKPPSTVDPWVAGASDANMWRLENWGSAPFYPMWQYLMNVGAANTGRGLYCPLSLPEGCRLNRVVIKARITGDMGSTLWIYGQIVKRDHHTVSNLLATPASHQNTGGSYPDDDTIFVDPDTEEVIGYNESYYLVIYLVSSGAVNLDIVEISQAAARVEIREASWKY